MRLRPTIVFCLFLLPAKPVSAQDYSYRKYSHYNFNWPLSLRRGNGATFQMHICTGQRPARNR